jgi:hypothetical protein
MNAKTLFLFLAIALMASLPAWADNGRCVPVGGVLMTDIALIDGVYNLGPVFGDLQGSVAAKIVSANADGTYTIQHSWVTTAGDIIQMSPAILKPAYPTPDKNIVAVPWGHYSSDITGGTGKFEGASGTIRYFGMGDFSKLTLVLRYRGRVCHHQ